MQMDAAGQLAADIDQALRMVDSDGSRADAAESAAAAAAAALEAAAQGDMELMEHELLVSS